MNYQYFITNQKSTPTQPMKKTFLFSFFVMLSMQVMNSQSTYFDVKESEKFVDKHRGTNVLTVHTTDKNETIIARSSRKKLIFEIYDENVKNTFNYAVSISKKEKVQSQLFFNNELKIFTLYSPSKSERVINCHILNLETKQHRTVELFKTTVEKKQVLFRGRNKRQTNFSISPNEDFLAIATDDIRKNSNSYLIHVFDAKSLTLLYTKSYYSNTEKYYTSSDMIVDNNGNVFTLGKEFFEGKKEKIDDRANYSFVITKINENDISSKEIALEENELIESLVMIDKDDVFDLFGFSSEKVAGRINSVSQIKLNPENLEILDKKRTKLPEQVYQDIYGSRKVKKKKNKELRSFYLDHVIEDELGNTYLLAEEFFITSVYVSNGMNGGGYTQTVYHYNDILILKLNAEGELDWGRSIFKKATEPSYNAVVHNNKLHVLLNSGKNLKVKEDGRTRVSQGWLQSSSLYDFIYDEKGDVTREKIQENKGKTLYIPYLGNYRNDTFIMFNRSKLNRRLMVLKVKK